MSALARPFVSLQARFLLGAVLVVAGLMVSLGVVVERRQRTTIVAEVERRGAVLARNLAAVSAGPLLLYHYTLLEQNVSSLAEDPDVTYAVILDAEGRVVADSREPGRVGAPAADPASRRAAAASGLLVQETAIAGEPHLDFALPVLVEGQRWGTVRVGLSRRRMEAEIAATRRELAVLGMAALALGGLGAWLVARRIARPVRRLADAAATIARGDLGLRMEPASADEIGQLARAFNHMVAELGAQRQALETAHGELARRFQELSDLKRYTDDLLASLATGIVTLDLEGRVVTLNPAAEALTGCALEAVRGRPAGEAFGHLGDLSRLLQESLAARRPAVAVTAVVPDGRGAVPLEVTTTLIRGGEGVVGVVAALRDLTAERELEAHLRRSERLAALGTLAAGLAHEIKNPLTSVLTFTRHLARRFHDERFRQRFQSVVPRELERINGIVEHLLRLARPGRLSLRAVHVEELVEQALELYAETLEARRVRVVREAAPALPAILADPGSLYQALVNLVANALEAMAEGGTLTIRTRSVERPGPGPGAGRWVLLEVEDTGVGIPPTLQAQVFNPFFTTKPGGTGLGLATAHRIVEDHRGSIAFRSVPGQGTTFSVLLPVTGPRPQEAEAAAPPPLRLAP